MDVVLARSLAEAYDGVSGRRGAELLAGGTDLMVEINFGRKRPERIVSIGRVEDLRAFERNGAVRMGALTTFTRMLSTAEDGLLALREMARTVGSPQIRNAGTLGGNLGTSSPAGDALPVLAAYDATVRLGSKSGERRIPFVEYMAGPKRSARRSDEIVLEATWDDPGPAQTFMKVGTRNAMVIAVASLCLVADRRRHALRVALGSCGPTIIRATEAEAFAAGLFDESGWERPLTATDAPRRRFGELVATAARPIDDVRGTAAYRRHVLAVMAERALARVGAIA